MRTLFLGVALVVFVRQERTPRVSGGVSLDHLRTVPAWRAITLAYALYAIAGGGFFAFVVAALEEDAAIGRGRAAAVYAGMGLVGAIFAPLTGSIPAHVSPMMKPFGSIGCSAVHRRRKCWNLSFVTDWQAMLQWFLASARRALFCCI